jgi:methylmalonyl-CoA/ethylmalonyl-CoA epimerase
MAGKRRVFGVTFRTKVALAAVADRGGGTDVPRLRLASSEEAADLRRLQAEGLELVDASPRSGADGKQVAFLHPNSTARVLVELCGHRSP